MKNTNIPLHRRNSQRKLLALAPMVTVMALSSPLAHAAAAITATAKLDAKTGKVVVTGKTAPSIDAGARISVYDAVNHITLYTVNTTTTKAFTMNLLATTTVPCLVRVEATNPKDNAQTEILVPVTGAPASCKTSAAVPACAILSPTTDTEIVAGSSLNFVATPKLKGDYLWSFNDGTADEKLANTNHLFKDVGKYRVTLTVTNSTNQCLDETMVSVIPPSGTNPNGKVPESIAPSIGEALPKADGSNDKGAYVVLPFEEMGMQGGSQNNLPYNVMIPYNSLNAQVIQKLEHKPPLLDNSKLNVVYSAASNAKDPLGKDSINSTSQNLFADKQVGGNYDVTSPVDPVTLKPTKNIFIDGHDYAQAKIRKTEQWDRMHQRYNKSIGAPETGTTDADNQSTFTPARPLALPDQGIRGYVDAGLGMRQMPGIKNPYIANDPQKFDYNVNQQAFVAQFVPASDIDDQGRTNPYPLMRVEAKVADKTVAKTDTVYTTASETRCRECHASGKIAADEDVWRMPVTTDELVAPDGTPGPATGAGNYDPGKDPTKPWPPAIHNKFDDTIPDNPAFSNLSPAVKDPKSVIYIARDQNNLRTDRVKESRWVKVDAKGRPTSTTSPTKPANADASWHLQVRLNFHEPKDEGGESWLEQEKAAVFNTLVMHDYMVPFGPTPATGKLWPASYSVQTADAYTADDKGTARANPMYFCSGHHQSSLKWDIGVGAKAFQTNRSDYSKAFHAFHGKMQVYKQDVSAAISADGLAHKKGDLIRDERGHPKMFGGRGWDSQHNDDNGVPLTADKTTGKLTVKTAQAYDTSKNNWRPDLFPADKNGEPLVKVGEDIPVEENCVKCHTGPTEKSYRDIHHSAGLKCDNCHGDMLAVGNVYPNAGYNANLSGGGAYTGDSINFRRPWLDNPDCGSCHMGDGNMGKGEKDAFSAGIMRNAWNPDDKAKRSRDPVNARFAVMPTLEKRPEKETVNGVTTYVPRQVSQTLYRKSADVHGTGPNGTLTCSTCHGGSHAIWPNQDPNANDNQTAKQLQGYDGNIAECSVCHVKDDFKTGLVATDGGSSGLGVGQGVRDGTVVNSSSQKAYLAGPHGMHPVGDESWYKNADGAAANTTATKAGFNGGWHNDFAKKAGPDGEDQCAACHGADHKGTRLSKTLTDRTLTNAKGAAVKVVKGQVIGCDLCHTLAVSFTDSPKGTAKMHPPPKPQTFSLDTTPATGGATTGTTTGGMGGMNMGGTTSSTTSTSTMTMNH